MSTQDKLAEALRAFPKDPNPFTYRRCYAKAQDALQAHAAEAAQAQAQSGEWVMVPREPTKAMVDVVCKIKLDRLEAFRSGREAISGIVSAVREEWEAMLAAAPQPQAAESHKGLLIGTTPSGVPYSLHGTKESVTAVSDMLEQAEVSRQLGADQPQSAEPVAVVKDSDALYTGYLSWTGESVPPETKLYTHPASADAERLAEALLNYIEPYLDTGDSRTAQDWAVGIYKILAHHSAQAQPPAASATPNLASYWRIVAEAAEVLQMVLDSGVKLPPNWRGPLLDELSGLSAMMLAETPQQAAEPVAVIESAEDRHGPYLTHANVVLRVWNGYVPKAGDEIYTHPQPAQDAKDAKDAARYRWLREHHDSTRPDWHVRTPTNDAPAIGALDAAIDAAMAKESGNG